MENTTRRAAEHHLVMEAIYGTTSNTTNYTETKADEGKQAKEKQAKGENQAIRPRCVV